MQAMISGFSEDHVVPAGKLVTLFSAPDYPQFQNVDAAERYKNAAAYVVLSAPGYDTPEVHHFEAALPRPEVRAGGLKVRMFEGFKIWGLAIAKQGWFFGL